MNQLNEIYLALKNQIFEGMIVQNKVPMEIIEGALAKIQVDLKTSQVEQMLVENYQMRQALQAIEEEKNKSTEVAKEEEPVSEMKVEG